MTEIVPFEYEGQPVRTIEIEGETWFIAADVCKILEIANGPDAVASLDQDEKQQVTVTIATGYGDQSRANRTQERVVWAISEPGVYALVGRSRKPEAKAFWRHVRHDILPTIRKTGAYVMSQLSRRQILQMALEAEEARERAETRLAELEPMAALAEAISINAERDARVFMVDTAAKLLANDPAITAKRVGQRKLFDRMSDLGMTFRSEGRWVPYQKEIAAGRLTTHTYQAHYSEAHGEMMEWTPGIRITWKGLVYIHRKLHGEIPLQQLVDQQQAQQSIRAVNEEPNDGPWWVRD